MSSVDYPALASEHLSGARLFATREDLIASLPLPSGPVVAEIGVALGDFSKWLIRTLQPSSFHAFDIFTIHNDAMLWGRPTSEVFGGRTHGDFYRAKMAGDDVLVHEGDSAQTLKELPANCLDLAYIDAQHGYDGVMADARECIRAAKPEGILVFNDYIMFDHYLGVDYGIVQVVNELVVNEGWKVIGFALQKSMFCDIAIQRR